MILAAFGSAPPVLGSATIEGGDTTSISEEMLEAGSNTPPGPARKAVLVDGAFGSGGAFESGPSTVMTPEADAAGAPPALAGGFFAGGRLTAFPGDFSTAAGFAEEDTGAPPVGMGFSFGGGVDGGGSGAGIGGGGGGGIDDDDGGRQFGGG